MQDRSEKALEYFRQGYNCSQAVLLACAPDLGLDIDTAARLASSFGGGLGRLREVCGAVSGMSMAAGLARGYYDPSDAAAKKAHYELIRSMAGEFRELNGSVVCREILAAIPQPNEREVGSARSPEQQACCERCVVTAARIAAEHL